MLNIGRVAFLTEMGWRGNLNSDAPHPNMRTEFCWMKILDADHFPIWEYDTVKNYDHVFVIFPKGKLNVNAEGTTIHHAYNPVTDLFQKALIPLLKSLNDQVHYVQEGPHWWFNDYDVVDQFHFYNMLYECDSIFTHNESDVPFYKGLFPDKKIRPIQSLMFDNQIQQYKIHPKEDKCIIGGNFARWYGGFQSYIVAQEFNVPIWTQTSHAMREHEDKIPDLNHLPRLMWNDWMAELSLFKYAVHLMPTVAAGTFSLNCAYFGIPCIGNEEVDTQKILHPKLSVDVENVAAARDLAKRIKNDPSFYEECSLIAREKYEEYYTPKKWIENFKKNL